MLQSSIRISSLKGDDYKRSGSEDTRFRDFNGAIQSIVTSSAQNDSGLFETNLHDERYLPFEGAGAVSKWKIELPKDIPQFDFETIADVVGIYVTPVGKRAIWPRLPQITLRKMCFKLLMAACCNCSM